MSTLTQTLRRAAFLCAFATSALVGTLVNGSEPKAMFSWDFNTQQDIAAWNFNCMTKPTLKDGALSADYTNWDPFVVSPIFEFKPQPGQYIEIRMKSTGNYLGEIFYAPTTEGPYGGFSQAKTTSWRIVHDGKWHTYQILPSWLAEPQIVRLRVDLGRPTDDEIKDGASVEIDYIRIYDLDIANTQAVAKAEWDEADLEKFQLDSDNEIKSWVSDIGAIDPHETGSNLYLEFTQDATGEAVPFPRANLRLLTGTGKGSVELQLPLFNLGDNGGDKFSKNVDLSAFGEWSAMLKDPAFRAYRWEISTPGQFTLKKLAFSKQPLGPGVVETQGNGNQTALARLTDGKAAVQYEALVRNGGGDKLANFQFATTSKTSAAKLLSVSMQKVNVDPLLGFNPTGDRLASKGLDNAEPAAPIELQADATGAVSFPADLELLPGEAFAIVMKYEVTQAGKTKTGLKMTANDQRFSFEPEFNVLSAIDVPKMDYVAAPQKLESDYEIGAFYFPGWSRRSGWDKIDEAAPIRKPLLGYYDEANPEVVDWQIKWAAENGIQFFFVDWYWKHGQVNLEHWIKAFQQAKYRSNLKWAVMWANHTGYGTHSTKDWEAVSKYWIENYFNTPEYYTIDGKPVVVMWDHTIVDHDMIEEAKAEGVELKAGEGCKRAFEIVRKACVDAGFPGVYFIAIKWPEHGVDPGTVQKYADAGFDATTIYHFMYGGKELKDPNLYSFDQVAAAQKPNWDERAKTGILPTIPNISTGWDSRPWHGFRNTVVYGRSVEAFRRILKDYKEYAKETDNKRVVLAPMNEWGEGSYIEPNNEFGFGMYEAIREELCKEPEGGFPVNYAPYEVGLGPYDLPKDK